MTTEALAIERMLWVQCHRCGGLMVPEYLDDSVLDADACKKTAWHCLTCNISVPSERTEPSQPRSGREGE